MEWTTMDACIQRTRIPKAPLWLGAAGLIPFVSCSLGVVAGGIDLTPLSLPLMTPEGLIKLQSLYGASILSFMGAVHWGLAMAGYQLRQHPVSSSTGKEANTTTSPHNAQRYGFRYGLPFVHVLHDD